MGTYSEKVIEHFQNPHNYGKIAKADGIGKVGNVVCLLPSQGINTDRNLDSIEKVSKKDKVLSHRGIYESVEKSSRKKHKGNVLSLKNKLGVIDLTPEHLVLAISVPNKLKFLRTKNKKELISSWYHARDLKKRDIILYPILKEEKDIKYLDIDIPKSKWDFKSKELPTKVSLDSYLLRLFGYFLSEGNIQDKPTRTYINFTLNIKERDIVEDIRKISKKLFNLDIVARERPETNTVTVYIYSARLARWVKQIFGNGALNKEIPNYMMILPSKKQRSLIYSLWKGDGYVNTKRDGPRAGYSTISYVLAQQVKMLLLRQGIISSIYTEKEKTVRGVNHKQSYRIHVGQRKSLLKLCSILKISYKLKSYPSEESWIDKDFLYTPITKIEKKSYDGYVYNLEVKDSHSFTSNAFCLHNCGDVMYLYIKVKDNVIKDVKYETFGCAAAIATSSVVTDLAKGMKILQALKMTNNSVLKELGGLPPIKVHCSLLAVDALNEAIYNYYKKIKKPIPKSLEKKHKTILKQHNQK